MSAEGITITTSKGKYKNNRRNRFRNCGYRGGYGNGDTNREEYRFGGSAGQNRNCSNTSNTYRNNIHSYPNNTNMSNTHNNNSNSPSRGNNRDNF